MGKIREAEWLGYFGIEREKAIWAGLSKKIPYEVSMREIGSIPIGIERLKSPLWENRCPQEIDRQL